MASAHKRALGSLQELGLSLYEAKLYLGLLTHGPQNGNELSRTSGVPSSKVYAILDRLTAAGIINHINRGSSSEYVCIAPDELLSRLRERYSKPIEYLEETLPLLGGEPPDLEILQISNAQVLIGRARAIIESASDEILISLWDESLDELHNELRAADARGVRIFAMIYGESTLDFGSFQHHSYRETIASRIGGHMLTLVADGQEALIVHMPEQGEPTGIHTRNPVLRLVAEEYLRHELILQKAKTLTGYDEWDRWLHKNADVRALTLGRGGRESSVNPDASATTATR
jgi:sugar-specific transcriptional regulator TrmB